MKIDFDSSVSQAEQRSRTAAAMQPGHKHTKQPGLRANERRAATSRRRSAIALERRRQERIRKMKRTTPCFPLNHP